MDETPSRLRKLPRSAAPGSLRVPCSQFPESALPTYLSDLLLANMYRRPDTDAGQHRDQRVDAEYVDLSSAKIANSGLSHAEVFGCLLLCETGALDVFREDDHHG